MHSACFSINVLYVCTSKSSLLTLQPSGACLSFLLSLLPDSGTMDLCGLASQASAPPWRQFAHCNQPPQPVIRPKFLFTEISLYWSYWKQMGYGSSFIYREDCSVGLQPVEMTRDYSADRVVYSQ